MQRQRVWALAVLSLLGCDTGGAMLPDGAGACPDIDRDGHAAVSCGGDDCDDSDPARHPGAQETCNGLDDDCNDWIDDASASPASPVSVITSASTSGFVSFTPDASGGVVATFSGGAEARAARIRGLGSGVAPTLAPQTNASPTPQITSMPVPGCPERILSPIGLVASCEGTMTCPISQVCVTAPDGSRVCEPPVVHNVPEHPGECQTQAECADGIACNGTEVCEPTHPASDARGCRSASTPPCGTDRCSEADHACVMNVPLPCAPAASATAFTSADELLGVAITTSGCAAGRVRLGVMRLGAMPTEVFWADDRVTTCWNGIDVGANSCTGASRPSGSPSGASAIAIAALPRAIGRDWAQGLAAWRGTSAMDSGPASVEVVGMWREQMGSTSVYPFADASDDGAPTTLGTTSARTIGVASYAASAAAAGYVVAFAPPAGGVSIAQFSALPDVLGSCPSGAVCAGRDPGPDMMLGTADDGEPFTRFIGPVPDPRTTPALGAPRTSALLAGSTGITEVSAAIGDTRFPGAIQLLVVAATPSEITLAMATLDGTSGMVTAGDTLHVSAVGPTDVHVGYVRAGFVDPSSTISDRGGYVITWAAAGGTYAARLADHTHALVAPGAVRLGDPSTAPTGFDDHDTSSASTLRVAAAQGNAIVVFPSVCGL